MGTCDRGEWDNTSEGDGPDTKEDALVVAPRKRTMPNQIGIVLIG